MNASFWLMMQGTCSPHPLPCNVSELFLNWDQMGKCREFTPRYRPSASGIPTQAENNPTPRVHQELPTQFPFVILVRKASGQHQSLFFLLPGPKL